MKRLKKAILVGIISFSIIYMMSVSLVLLLDKDDNESGGGGLEAQFFPIVLEYEIKGIRLTFIDNFNDSVVISWFTDWSLDNYEPFVRYSSKSDLSNFIEIKPNRTKISGTIIYIAELVDLRPNTTYFYQIRCDEYSKREIMSFTTMANNTDHIRFLVYGDNRTFRDRRSNLCQKIMENFKDNFEFTINTGDMVEKNHQWQWDNHFIDTEIVNAYKIGIYCEGNHETTSDGESPETRMYDEIAYSLRKLDAEKPEVLDERVRHWASQLGVEPHLGRAPFRLSGGEKQRVCLAALLALEPKLLLLDEPTANLDPRSTGWLIDFLQDLPVTSIATTHNLGLAAELGTRTLALSERHELIFDGSLEELLANEEKLLAANLVHSHRHRHGGSHHRHYHAHDWS